MSSSIFDQITSTSVDIERQKAKESSIEEHSDNAKNVDDRPDTPSQDAEPRTESRLREVAQYLLATGVIEQSDKSNLYRIALTQLTEINTLLEPLDLHVQADEIRGLLCLMVRKDNLSEGEEWAHPLVRKQRLTLEQSLLVALLRQHFVSHEQEHGVGAGDAVVNVDELSSHLQMYLGNPGSETKERNRTLQLLDQLKSHGLVTSPDSHDRVAIRPLIAHLANPENLQALLHKLQQMSNTVGKEPNQ